LILGRASQEIGIGDSGQAKPGRKRDLFDRVGARCASREERGIALANAEMRSQPEPGH
jgi:hypothetical protein